MPWWTWLLLWSGMTLALLGVGAVFLVRLFRASLRILGAVKVLTDQISRIETRRPPDTTPPFRPAVFDDTAPLLRDLEVRRAHREHRRQVRRDARIVRGKLLRHAR